MVNSFLKESIKWVEVVLSMKTKRQNLEMKLPPKITIAEHFKELSR